MLVSSCQLLYSSHKACIGVRPIANNELVNASRECAATGQHSAAQHNNFKLIVIWTCVKAT
jgi:hypothetical protein